MRNLVFVSMVLAGLAGHAQIPVTDAAAGASLTAINAQITTGNMTLQELVSIQTAAKGEAVNTQTNTLNTLKQAEKMYEIYTKINNAITTVRHQPTDNINIRLVPSTALESKKPR